MELIEVATELTEVRGNKNKNLYHGSRNRGEGLDLRILETEGGGKCPKEPRTHRLWGTTILANTNDKKKHVKGGWWF